MISPVTGCLISNTALRPSILSASGSTTSPSSITAFTFRPLCVPQSSSVIIQSWATSTKRRVRYPELAVFKAVSANPFRAPWVELKYSSTVKPSLKLEIMGVSIISPEGLAIRPRIPASCFIWAGDPRAPECAIIQTELTSFPSSGLIIRPIISSATWSVQRDQTSTTLLYFSPCVINPSRYCCSNSFTSSVAVSTRLVLVSGMIKSSFPNEIPDVHAWLNPSAINLSANMTVSFCPQCRYTLSITFDISFLVINLFIVSNGILELSGKYCARRNLPGVDSTTFLTLFPSSSNVSILDFTFAWRWTEPLCRACSISAKSAKIRPSPSIPSLCIVRWYKPKIISWEGTMIGLPFAGLRMLLVDIMRTRASSWASRDSGTWTAIWSPSKSALKAVQTKGCNWIAFPSIRTGSNACMPSLWSVGARLSSTGCSRITSSKISQTSGRSFSTIRLAAFMVVARPYSSNLE